MSERKKKLIPQIMVDLNQNCLRIRKDTIRALGNPRYVCLLDNMDKNTIAIAPCEEKMVTSFKVPDGFPEIQRKEFRIHSKKYVASIRERAPWMKESTLLIGSYDEVHNAAVFSLQKEDQTNARVN